MSIVTKLAKKQKEDKKAKESFFSYPPTKVKVGVIVFLDV